MREGRHLNRAGADVIALSAQLPFDISALTQSVQNIKSRTNFAPTVEDGLTRVYNLVDRGRELVIKSSDLSLKASERQTLN